MTAEAERLQRQLSTAQNPDGGWGYQPGTSWTEPTALALLALSAYGIAAPGYARGCEWLSNNQKSDGGWAPNPAIEISTWVTSAAALALSDTGFDPRKLRGAMEWILRQVNPEPSPVARVVFRLLGVSPPKAPGGSPWFPGTAAWIAPSVMAVLALSRAARMSWATAAEHEALRSAILRTQQYILLRRCRDGGWNHGGSPFRSEDAESYPEMTGMALLALRGVSPAQLDTALERAEVFASRPQSMEAASWLQLGLSSQGRHVQVPSTGARNATLREVCLRLLALAEPAENNKLWMLT
jgi:hypothetical protein